MLISTARHKRIVAEKDAEIAGLMKRIRGTIDLMEQANDLIINLRARLAPFTKIRNRDSRGHFIKDTVA